jgi:hypothetical protein
MQQKEDIDAVLAEIDGVEECRRRLKEDGAAARAGRRRAMGWTAPPRAPAAPVERRLRKRHTRYAACPDGAGFAGRPGLPRSARPKP